MSSTPPPNDRRDVRKVLRFLYALGVTDRNELHRIVDLLRERAEARAKREPQSTPPSLVSVCQEEIVLWLNDILEIEHIREGRSRYRGFLLAELSSHFATGKELLLGDPAAAHALVRERFVDHLSLFPAGDEDRLHMKPEPLSRLASLNPAPKGKG
ncbi:MAG: hypothetical protein SF028_00610 [Candidatus Sumerlaeia bacterium]|nr:hypothetical protein [Candidatus Sumerlaeia bacterium]